MNKKFRFKAATTIPCSNKTKFTDESLKQFADKAVGIPVTDNFDNAKTIGEVTKAIVKDNYLEVEISLIDPDKYLGMIQKGAIPVPGYINYEAYTDEDNILVIEKLKPICLGLTLTPAEKGLRRIKDEPSN